MMSARFVTTSQGQLQTWQHDPAGGSRDPVVVLPGLVTAGAAQLERLASALPDRTWIVVAHPGTSSSTDVEATPARAAAFVAEILEAAGLGDAPVVAVGLGAALLPHLPGRMTVALDLTSARRMSEVDLDPADLEPRADGTHLPALWAFLRDRLVLGGDQSTPDPGRAELPSPTELDATFLAYAPQPEAYARWWGACAAEVRGLADDALTTCDTVAELDLLLPRTGPWTPPPAAPGDSRVISRDHVDTTLGRLHLRRAGTGPGRPLLMCHSAPGSASNLEPMMRALGVGRPIVAPDYLGNGESAKPELEHPSIADVAAPLVELVDQLAAESPDGRVDLWGTHTGALVVLEISKARPDTTGRMIMEAPPILDAGLSAEILEHYLPPIEHDRWGLHTLRAWNMRRDMFLFWPWYDDRVSASRTLGVPDAGDLHAWTIGLLQSGTTFHRSYRAAFEYDTRAELPNIPVPTLICAGPTDMLVDGLGELAELAPTGTQVTTTPATCWYPAQPPAAFDATISAYDTFLRGA